MGRNIGEIVTVDIKVGDKVQVDMDTPTASFHGVEGIVAEIIPGKSSGYVRITKSNSKVEGNFPAGTRMYLYGLTKMEETFTFKDIQKGDKVRRTETWESGTVKSVEGVVVNLNSSQATTKEGLTLGYYGDEDNKHMVLELVEKAKPKSPELWENRKAGDKIATYSTQDGNLERLLTKREDGLWDTLVMNTIGVLQEGFERSDEEVALHITRHSNAAKAHLVK
jgi:hypothetical protein